MAMRAKQYGLLVFILLMVWLSCPIAARPRQKLAFASDRAGNGDIFVQDTWGRLTNITHSSAGDWDPQWSPDGTQLAFTSHRAGQSDIWIMNADGTHAVNLSNNPAWDYSPSWSPDGTQVVFISERDGDAELFVQPLGGAQATQLTTNTHPDKLPAWSPAGDRIAFAAVVNGIEQVYLLDLTHQNAITPLLNAGLNGTSPAWSPDGTSIAFVGWKDTDAINIFLLNLASRRLQRLYSDTAWIGSLSWSVDGQWLFFTGRQNGNHNVMALNVADKQVYQLTRASAWDDFPSLSPRVGFLPLPYQQFPAPHAGDPTFPPDDFGYGVNLADLSNAYLIQDMHFNAIKSYVNWATVEPVRGEFRWVDPDNVLKAAAGAGADVLLRIHGTPDWARPPNSALSHPPTDPADFAQFLTALVARYRGRVRAYEIWNEPNLDYEWGYRTPSPVEYTALLQTAYQAIKAADPTALVVSAGLAPTGDGNPPHALGDLDFIEGMYRAGAQGYFDALGSHLYTYGLAPDDDDPRSISFNRAAQYHQIMVAYRDGTTPIWITEMGWNLQTHWDLGKYHQQGVTELTQAMYLQRAYMRIRAEWPWVQAAYLFNLDFSAAPWYPADEQMRWYAVLNPDRTPRPAFTALRKMQEKRTGN